MYSLGYHAMYLTLCIISIGLIIGRCMDRIPTGIFFLSLIVVDYGVVAESNDDNISTQEEVKLAISVYDERDSTFDLGCPDCISGVIGRAESKEDFLKLMENKLLEMGHKQVGTKFYCGECKIEMEWQTREGPRQGKDDTHMIFMASCDRCGKKSPPLRFKYREQYITHLTEQGWVVGKEIECQSCCNEKRMKKVLRLQRGSS